MNERPLTQKALVSLWLLCGGGCTLGVLDDLSTGVDMNTVQDAGMDGGSADGGLDAGERDAAVVDAGHDAGAIDAGSDAGCHTPPTDHKRVFVTSDVFTTNLLGGVGGADLLCQQIADAECLGGTWLAWLSQIGSSPATRFEHATVPYRRLDGVQIANNWTDLTDGSLDDWLSIDETGHEQTTSYVWTGTSTAGNTFTSRHCDNWTSGASDAFAKTGNMSSAGMDWTHNTDKSCADAHRMYCFEQ